MRDVHFHDHLVTYILKDRSSGRVCKQEILTSLDTLLKGLGLETISTSANYPKKMATLSFPSKVSSKPLQ